MAGGSRTPENQRGNPQVRSDKGAPKVSNRSQSKGKFGTCGICRKNKVLIGSFCKSCDRKSKGRGINKAESECTYGRCIKERERGGFLGLELRKYCPEHQRKFERGIL